MRIALVGAVLVLAACGGHRAAAPGCTLTRGPEVPAHTGEHALPIRSTCGMSVTPRIDLDGLPFILVPEGGPKGAHVVILDKYRCDIRTKKIGRIVRVNGAALAGGLDWCPAQAVSTVVHVYLGSVHRHLTRHDVFRDAYDGTLDRVYPCGVLRDAIAHLPVDGPTYSVLPEKLGRAASTACSAAIGGIRVGAPRFAVEAVFGASSFGGPQCPVWRWAPYASPVDGVRVCFAHDRATKIQTALHG